MRMWRTSTGAAGALPAAGAPASAPAWSSGMAALARDEAARAALLRVLVVGWSLAVFAAYQPGLMTPDSIGQYWQGIHWYFGTWAPPLGSMLSGLAGKLAGSPWPLFLAQVVALPAGMAALVRRPGHAPVATLAVFVAFLVAPPVWGIANTLYKDVWMVVPLVFAVVALRRGHPVAAAVAAVIAALLRYNAIFAVVPLLVPMTAQLARTRVGRAVAGAAVIAACLVVPPAVARAVRAIDEWPLGSLLVYDLAGIEVERPDLFAGSVLAKDVSLEELRALYSPYTGAPLFWEPNRRTIQKDLLPARRAQLEAEWLHTLPKAWKEYLRHRVRVFEAQLALQRGPVFLPFQLDIEANPWGFDVPKAGAAWRIAERVRHRLKDTPLFRGWLWLALSAAGCIAAAALRREKLAAWVAASGLAYTLAYAVIGVAADFRYVYWTVITVFITAMLLADAPATAGAPGSEE
ncbi:hypothetical protein [Anaeromyxobacter oryzae]|uniref:Glycosyltransferase RgtA/B/C/D-like domain-containing protein n=1 Tax=Anaeromyxobacter oryzae TaxID=2918170 RepID=A0ABM7WQI7_9BACT|nr:hypothetical protein [Anaeromyxobacter oryzae]BDG01732.1 hypothetical protein AMOR_07280 [Anaeromyxobacter oryzae]